jgi:hypothetical protein
MPLSPPLIFNFIKKLSDIAATILNVAVTINEKEIAVNEQKHRAVFNFTHFFAEFDVKETKE